MTDVCTSEIFRYQITNFRSSSPPVPVIFDDNDTQRCVYARRGSRSLICVYVICTHPRAPSHTRRARIWDPLVNLRQLPSCCDRLKSLSACVDTCTRRIIRDESRRWQRNESGDRRKETQRIRVKSRTRARLARANQWSLEDFLASSEIKIRYMDKSECKGLLSVRRSFGGSLVI